MDKVSTALGIGSWYVDDDMPTDDGGRMVVDYRGRWVATARTTGVARLCAAAPELVEVVEGLASVLTTMNREYQPEQIFDLLDAWNVRARAAIAKARGEVQP